MDAKLDGIRRCFWHVITPRAKRSNPYANAYQVRESTSIRVSERRLDETDDHCV